MQKVALSQAPPGVMIINMQPKRNFQSHLNRASPCLRLTCFVSGCMSVHISGMGTPASISPRSEPWSHHSDRQDHEGRLMLGRSTRSHQPSFEQPSHLQFCWAMRSRILQQCSKLLSRKICSNRLESLNLSLDQTIALHTCYN